MQIGNTRIFMITLTLLVAVGWIAGAVVANSIQNTAGVLFGLAGALFMVALYLLVLIGIRP